MNTVKLGDLVRVEFFGGPKDGHVEMVKWRGRHISCWEPGPTADTVTTHTYIFHARIEHIDHLEYRTLLQVVMRHHDTTTQDANAAVRRIIARITEGDA